MFKFIGNKNARSFVAIMIAIALSALLLRFAVLRLISISIQQNEAHASEALKLVSVALENYAKDKGGAYPKSLSLLAQAEPPYLKEDYGKQFSLRGYAYECLRLEPDGYSCSAKPVLCKITGKTVYTISTGGLLISEECDKKE